MPTQYLLPCPSCGEKVPVETSQAGERVRCACGAELDVPSMRGLRQLEVAAEPNSATSRPSAERNWGPRQGLILAGSLILLFGLLPAGWLYWQLPDPYQLDRSSVIEFNEQEIDNMTIDQTWMVWKQGIEGAGLVEYPSATKEAHETRRAELRNWIVFSLSIAALGLVLLVTGLLWQPGPRRPSPVA